MSLDDRAPGSYDTLERTVLYQFKEADGLTRRAPPAPGSRIVSIPPSQQWNGNDGRWSTFLVGAGSPLQFTNVLISTTATTPWFVLPQGCTSRDSSGCPNDRGGIYDPAKSTSWQAKGNYTLEYEENLGYTGNGQYGFETITLGIEGSSPNLTNQLITGIASKDFYIPTWGVRPAPTNLSSFSNPIPSWVSGLKDGGYAASLSWAYTAGSYANSLVNKQSLASLSIGGYDASLFVANNATFRLAATDQRDIVVGLRSITAGGKSLLPQPILAFIDAGVSHIWLPEEACRAFEQQFSLTWNSTLELYLVNDTVHDNLLKQNASIEFAFSNDLGSSTPNATIVLPYTAFDQELTAEYPGIDSATRYFPIRRAANATQFTLGRTFFQHAYVIADYERHTFSVNQALFPSTPTQDLREILPPSVAPPTGGPSLVPSNSSTAFPTGAIVGIVIGVVVVIAALGGLAFWRRRRRRRARDPYILMPELDAQGRPRLDADGKPLMRAELRANLPSELQDRDKPGPSFFAPWRRKGEQELEGTDAAKRGELPSREPVGQELEGRGNLRAEMDGHGRLPELLTPPDEARRTLSPGTRGAAGSEAQELHGNMHVHELE